MTTYRNLGRSFGLEYVFRELPTNRWSPDLNESKFLGLGIGEKRIEDFPDYEIVSVDGAATSYALKDGRPLSSVLPPKMPEKAIVEFVHSGQMYSNGIPVPILHKIDLRERLILRHGDQARSSGGSKRSSDCVYIRQGDLHVGEARRPLRISGNAEDHDESRRRRHPTRAAGGGLRSH